MTAILEARGVRVDYGAFTALADFDLVLGAGHLLGLVGPNGAGKTTALRCLAGLLPLTAGQVRVLGQDLLPENRAVMGQIGFTPDTPALYDGLTVSEFLRFIGKAYGLERSTIDERMDFWLEQLWLADRVDARIQTLSRGMRQRLAVARTLLPNPSVILLDEPAAGLDPAGRVQFRNMLASLRDQGKALIVSSHILADLDEYCTHVAVMEAGRLLRFDTVASFVGGAGNRCRYGGRVASSVHDLAERLGRLDRVSHVVVANGTFSLEFDSGPAAAAALLRTMIEQGVPVASFHEEQRDLERAYLSTGIRQVD